MPPAEQPGGDLRSVRSYKPSPHHFLFIESFILPNSHGTVSSPPAPRHTQSTSSGSSLARLPPRPRPGQGLRGRAGPGARAYF